MNPPTNNSLVRNCNETDFLGMSISIYHYTIYSTEIQINYRKKQVCLLVLLNGVPTYQTNGKQCRNGISDDGLVFNSKTILSLIFTSWSVWPIIFTICFSLQSAWENFIPHVSELKWTYSLQFNYYNKI
jgi:hypothetical protein